MALILIVDKVLVVVWALPENVAQQALWWRSR
jgi:hypothetical protein